MLDTLANNPLLQLLLLALAIVAAVWTSNHRERRQRVSRRSAAPQHPPLTTPSQTITSDTAWLDELVTALHLLVIGHSQGGKTTLIHELARRLAIKHPVIVCDPDAAPGLWPGCAVHGYANDFAAIDRALAYVRREVERRRSLRGTGRQRIFPALYLVIDEYQDIGRGVECPTARPLAEDILRRGGKLNVHLIIGVQDKQVKTMGFEGQGDLRRNFTSIVEVRSDRGGRRWATVATPSDEDVSTTYQIPTLPGLEHYIKNESGLTQASLTNAVAIPIVPVEHREMPVAFGDLSRETPENAGENLQRPETHFPAPASDVAVFEPAFSLEEIAQIAAMIARGGKGKTEIVQAMPGYSGRKHKAYAAWYDKLREAIEATAV